MTVPALLLVLAGALALVHALLARANPHDRLPWWGRAARSSRSGYAAWLVAAACAGLAVGLSDRLGGMPALALAAAVLLGPGLLVTVVHNRRSARRRPGLQRTAGRSDGVRSDGPQR